MVFKRLKFNWKKESKSQSLVELAFMFMTLLSMLAVMVEGGNLLNQYINLVDGAREGARSGSTDDPLYEDPISHLRTNYRPFFAKIYLIIEGNKTSQARGAIYPLTLSKENGDDIVITFYSITTQAGSFTHATPFYDSNVSEYGNKSSLFDPGKIAGLIDTHTPNTGLVVVEIFYNYNQILRFFSFTNDPAHPELKYTIPLHAYSIMPLSAAEPTPTP
jgi:hypothetical protein